MAPIAPSAVAVSVPVALTVSVSSIPSSSVGPLVRALEAQQRSGLREDDILALWLVYERWVAGASSVWAPHISRLPESVDSPFAFSTAELAATRGTSLAPIATQMQRQVAEDHATLSALLTRCDDSSAALLLAALTPSAYAWAVSIVWSRFLTLPLGAAGEPVKTMVPFLDFANHEPGARAAHHRYDAASRAVVVEAGPTGLASGEQLCIHYGPLPPRVLLQLHGFVLPPGLDAASEWHPFPITLPDSPTTAGPSSGGAGSAPPLSVRHVLGLVLRGGGDGGAPPLLPPGAPGAARNAQGTLLASAPGSALTVELALFPPGSSPVGAEAPHALLLPVGRVLYAAYKPVAVRAVLLRLIAAAPRAPLPAPHEGFVVVMLRRSIAALLRELPSPALDRLAALESSARAAAAAADAVRQAIVAGIEAPAAAAAAASPPEVDDPAESTSYRLGSIAAVAFVERAALAGELRALQLLADDLGMPPDEDDDEL